MPVVDNTSRQSRTVSFAENLVDTREEAPLRQEEQQQPSAGAGVAEAEPASPASTNEEVNPDDGTGRRFKIPFQEHRLRFDQKFPKGLDMRIPESEYEIVLEQIHRELIKPVDKSQKSVRKWSKIVAGTVPIGVGFFLSMYLANRVNKHQKALKIFWLSLRNHLKALNREIYFARGIEWRIERDFEKISEREAYNKLLSFRMEIVFRKPITLRSGREVALNSVIESNRTRIASSIIASDSRQSRFADDSLADPALLALLGPGDDEHSNSPILEEEGTEDREIYSSPFLIPDHMVVAEASDQEEDLIIKVDEPAEVAQARVTSNFEPPSPTPVGSVFTADSAIIGNSTATESQKMTFADLLRSSVHDESENIRETDGPSTTGVAVAAGAVGLTAAAVGTSLNRSPSPPHATPELSSDGSSPSTPESREEAFAQRQRKKFSRQPTLATQLYAIPESPKLGADDDPAGDAMNYLNSAEDDDLIDDILGNRTVSFIPENFEPKPVVTTNFEDLGPVPVAAYPLADPFSPLYETDKVTPVDPPIETDEDLEYTEVDGETEYIRRKKWRVAPESAGKLARVQTMSEAIKPSSRRSSYLPVTKSKIMPETVNFDQNK